MITKLCRRADGTYLGEDEDGKIYAGTIRKAGFDEVTRVVEQGGGEYTLKFYIGEQLWAKSRGEGTFNVTPWSPPKEYANVTSMVRDADGKLVLELNPETGDMEPKTEEVQVEKRVEIIEWSELS